MQHHRMGADPGVRIHVTGGIQFELASGDLWKIIFERRLVFFLSILGFALAALVASNIPGTFSLSPVATVVLILTSILLFLTPFSVTILTALLCLGLFYIARKMKLSILGFDGNVVRIRWIVMLVPSLYINISVMTYLIDAVSGYRIPTAVYVVAPIYWIVVSEVFTAFAVKYLLSETGLIVLVNRTDTRQEQYDPVGSDKVAAVESTPLASTKMTPWQIHLGQISVNLKDPIILRAEGNYVEFTDPSGGRLVRTTLSSALAKIRSDAGLQIHRSYWTSFSACERLEFDGQEVYLHTNLGERLKVAKPRQAHVLRQLERRNLRVTQ